MGVAFYRSLWGPMPTSDDITGLPALCADTVARGYLGVESNPLLWGDNADAARRIIEDHGLRFLARAHTFGRDVATHVEFVRRCVEAALPFGTPHVIVQSGSDSFSDGEVDDYFARCAQIEKDHAVRLVHETHRACILYSPWAAARVLDRWPELWLAADYSHWVLVCERLLDVDELARFAPRVAHIDARVGSQEAPQVADPRTRPKLTAGFVAYWDAIRDAGNLATVVPEFGPPPYAPVDAADLDDISQWMADHLRERWT
ncbi:MAG: hypothetical protein QOK28_1332 [Actinomycetota bacterium]